MNAKDQSSQTSTTKSSPRHRVLVLDDEWSTLERIKAILEPKYQVTLASRASEAAKLMAQRPFQVVLSDVRMPDQDGLTLVTDLKRSHPDTQYILMTAFSDIEDTITALRLGVADYLRKPFSEGEVLHALNRCLERRRLEQEVAILRQEHGGDLPGVITSDPRMQDLCRLGRTAAVTDATILISGETGTGKGLMSRGIHEVSNRRGRPLVEIDCASIPATLIESELFGHERGSFTGAVHRKLGRVETAEGGTLVLDEVGEMPLELQPKLLRFLQSFNFERVGGNKRLQADVRVIACTNRDLAKAVKDGLFRQDLFYRLHVIHVPLPPLRERGQDILLLAERFLQHFADKYSRPAHSISAVAQQQLMAHSWPGNIRELEHCVERAVILCPGDRLERFELSSYHPSTPAIPMSGPETTSFPEHAFPPPQTPDMQPQRDKAPPHPARSLFERISGDLRKAVSE
jgi:DNA-binding NtrC family response regulator